MGLDVDVLAMPVVVVDALVLVVWVDVMYSVVVDEGGSQMLPVPFMILAVLLQIPCTVDTHWACCSLQAQ